MTDTPCYYQLETGDLYDLFIAQRGLDVVRQHLEMAAIEYLWRCRHKGQYLRDLEKVRVIVDRLIDMADHEATIQDTLDRALLVLGQVGWGVVPPPAPQETHGTHVAASEGRYPEEVPHPPLHAVAEALKSTQTAESLVSEAMREGHYYKQTLAQDAASDPVSEEVPHGC